jgi:arylsulfatase
MARFLSLCLILFLASFVQGKPNVIFILADDLGYADLGCYGQKKIRTPSLDRLATQGMRFTQNYAGCPVCAPSRCCLMTGKHGGHAYIRDNKATPPEGQEPLAASEVMLSELLKRQGYATGAIGKWGLGMFGTEGDPLKRGFDFFFGYNCQAHAHNHYPRYLYRNSKRFDLEGNDGSATGKQFSHDLFEKEALSFVRSHKDKPFFLYLPFTIPHLALQVPEDSLAEYKGKWEDPPYKGGKGYQPHPTPRAAYAAMIARMDRTVVRLMDLVKELGLEENTIVLFSSDNGPAEAGYAGTDSVFFGSAGPFRGYKGEVYEGGIRVPLIFRWPGKIKAGTVSEHVCYFPDLMPTLLDLIGARKETPKDIDGVSYAPTLLGKPDDQKQRDYLIWDFPGYGGQQAVRMGDWKAVRRNLKKGNLTIELYNLKEDIGEKHDVASDHPELVKMLQQIMNREHTPSKLFPVKVLDE